MLNVAQLYNLPSWEEERILPLSNYFGRLGIFLQVLGTKLGPFLKVNTPQTGPGLGGIGFWRFRVNKGGYKEGFPSSIGVYRPLQDGVTR